MAKIKVTEPSESFKLNSEDMKKLGKSFLLALGGFVLTFLADMIPNIDFGQFTSLVYSISPFVLNFVRKLLIGKGK